MAKRLRKRVSKKARLARTDADEGAPASSEVPDAVQDSNVKAQADEASAPAVAPPTSTPAPEPEADDGTGKKRKRTRKRKRSHAPHAGPDVSSMEELSETAQRAIAYAQLFLTDKSAWKFSKQKQNWLLRHMLWSPALVRVGEALGQASLESIDEALRAAAPPAVALPEHGAWIDDAHVSVVAHYLASVAGLAQQRMKETLGLAATPPEGAAALAEADTEASQAESASPPARSNDTAGPLVAQWFRLRVERATSLLEWILACQDTPT
ncbi:hypothetical protein MNAN1_000966 [Malassezia nana]|uniref:WKF domain-containing protein n=1 Tax=Malassezia nana TaxID=180528 RepID=A0AAF0EJQ3_9BASI|nr:hypothetical protein MNAN1_000966 [Malassezia nana]